MTDASPSLDLQQLIAQEPFVRSLARQLLAEEADEVVQQTYLQAIQHERPPRATRPWLATIAHNVAANLRRNAARRRTREAEAAARDLVPSSAELMEREERRRALVCAVDRLPDELRTTVLLRYFEQRPPRVIAGDLGVPVATIWNRLRRALVLLRRDLDTRHRGGRRAWLLPLIPLATHPSPAATATLASTLTFGVIPAVLTMTMKTKIVILAGLLALGTTALLVTSTGGSPDVEGPSEAARAVAPIRAGGDTPDPPTEIPPPNERAEIVTPTQAVATTGSLRVIVRHADGTPAVGVGVGITRGGGFGRRLASTGPDGTATLAGLEPGRKLVVTDRRTTYGNFAEVVAGREVELEIALREGVDLDGRVVDADGNPVGGAVIELSRHGIAEDRPTQIATSDAAGRFALRAIAPSCGLRARAAGYATSPIYSLHASAGSDVTMQLTLDVPGGSVGGTVLDPDGQPAAGAVVRFGPDEMDSSVEVLADGAEVFPPGPVDVQTGSDGTFLAVGLPIGTSPVLVRSPAFAPWQGSCEVPASGRATLHVRLDAGATCSGTVRDPDGKVLPRIEIESGDWDSLLRYQTFTDASGHYELRGLPLGDVELKASSEKLGRAQTVLQTVVGAAVTWDVVLSRGTELHGRVIDESNEPLADVQLHAHVMGSPSKWWGHARTDAAGRFVIANCPDRIVIEAVRDSFRLGRKTGVDPRAGELILHVRDVGEPSVHLTGTVLDADGNPIEAAQIMASCPNTINTGVHTTEAGTGRFALGPMRPAQYTVTVQATGHATYRSNQRELLANDRWDLGEIRLERGGTLAAHIDRSGISADAELRLTIRSLEGRYVTRLDSDSDGDTSRSRPIAAGRYRLFVTGDAIAAAALPFEIRTGESTRLDVRPRAGTACEVRVLQAGGADRLKMVIECDGATVAELPVHKNNEGNFVERVALAPGRYRAIAITAERRRGEADFVVTEQPGDPTEITVR